MHTPGGRGAGGWGARSGKQRPVRDLDEFVGPHEVALVPAQAVVDQPFVGVGQEQVVIAGVVHQVQFGLHELACHAGHGDAE